MSRSSAFAALALIYLVRAGLAVAVFFARPIYFGVGILLALVITMSPQGIGGWWLSLPVIAAGIVLCVNNARVQDRFESWLRQERPHRSDGRSDDSLLQTLKLHALASFFLVLVTALVSFISSAAHLRHPSSYPNDVDELASPLTPACSGTILQSFDASTPSEKQFVHESDREFRITIMFRIIIVLVLSFLYCLIVVIFLVKWLNARCQT